MIPSNKINLIQKKMPNQVVTTDGGYLNFNIDDLKLGAIDEILEFENNGLIKFKEDCIIKVNAKVWIGSTTGQARPWLKLMDYTNSKTLDNSIDDNSSKFVSLIINNYCFQVVKNQEIGILLTNNETVIVNQNSGDQNSFINIEVVK